jgi:hypothetical protein
VVGGLLFAAVELVHYRRQRKEAAAIELARSFQSPEFAHALGVVLALPPGLDADGLRAVGPEAEDAALLVSLTLESVGIMVHRRVVELDLVWELMGGVTLAAWERLEGWIRGVREEHGREKFDEWLEWLAGQLRRSHEAPGGPPAHIRYDGWKPRRRVW